MTRNHTFDLTIERTASGTYRVAGAGESEPFALPFQAAEVRAVVGWRAGDDWPLATPTPATFGDRLFRALLSGSIGAALARQAALASGEHTGLRISLHLDDAPVLAALPWELLHNPLQQHFPDLVEVIVSPQIGDSEIDRAAVQNITVINSGGGAVIQGNVETGGDFIGRDLRREDRARGAGWSRRVGSLLAHRIVRLALAHLLFALLVAGALVPYARAHWVPLCPRSQPCILVAHIWPQENEKAQRLTTEIRAKVEDAVSVEGTPFLPLRDAPAVTSAAQAKKLARTQGALLVVWGLLSVDAENEVNVRYELTDLLGVGESAGVRPYRAQPLVQASIAETVQCSGDCIHFNSFDEAMVRVDVIAHTAAGLARYVQGEPALAQRDFETALACAQGEATCATDARATTSGVDLLHYYLGKSLVLQGDYADGIATLQQADQEDPATWIGIGTALQSWGGTQTEEAVEALDRAQRLAQAQLADGRIPNGIVYFHLGLIAELRGAYGDAQVAYRRAAARFADEDDPDDPSAPYVSLIGLGRVQRLNGDVDAAQQTLTDATDLVPAAPWAYLELAQLHQDDRAQAETYLTQAAQTAPHQAYVSIVRGELCRAWQDFTCVIDAYQRALAQRPGSGWVYGRLGELYLPTNPILPHQRWSEAERYDRLAVEQRPHDPWAHERLGYVLAQQQKHANAADEYELAAEFAYAPEQQRQYRCLAAQIRGQSGETGTLPDGSCPQTPGQ